MGSELDEQVAVACGWRQYPNCVLPWYGPYGHVAEVPPYSTDLSLAMGLLLSYVVQEREFSHDDSDLIDNNPVSITILGDSVEIHDSIHAAPLASGPKSDLAKTICEAFLKLKATP